MVRYNWPASGNFIGVSCFHRTTFEWAGNRKSTGWFAMPAVWNGVSVNGRALGGSGFATFRLRLRVDPLQGRQALLIPYAFTAYRMWIDNRLAVVVGRVGKSADNHDAKVPHHDCLHRPPGGR